MAEAVKNSVLVPMKGLLDGCKSWVNQVCGDLEPWQIVLYTGGSTFVVLYLRDFLFQDDERLSKRMRHKFFKLVRKIPQVRRKVEEEMGKVRQSMEESLCKDVEGSYLLALPEKGLGEEELFKELERYKKMSGNQWKKGMVSGVVYNGDDTLTAIMTKAYGMFTWANPLHPDVFPDIRKMEAEVVRMCCTMFHGDDESTGTVNSGGTESIMLACLAYRNMARERGIKIPEIIVPVTAHAAFDKAAYYFHMSITHIPVDEITRQVNVKAMRRAIGRRTCMLVVSAPQFPHGIIDPVVEVGKLGKEYNIPVHVDSCLGGFLVPFMEKAGFPVAPFDFRVDGVTSISADTHKYGFAPKGSSVVLYRNKEYRNNQFYVMTDWTGGIYATPTLAGSRAGATIAACWAAMVYFGQDGYVDSTRRIVSTARKITNMLREIPSIFVFGEPQVSVVGIGSKDFNVFRLFDALVEKGWNLNSLQFPSSLHLCVTLPQTQPGVAEEFVNDVKNSVTEIMKDPSADCSGDGAIYGMAQSIPDRSLVNEIAGAFLECCYLTKSSTPAIKPASTNGLSNGAGDHVPGKH